MKTKVIPDAFSSCILQSCKITAKYVGNRELNSSGLFGGSFSLNPVDKKSVDTAASVFENVNNGMNPILSHVLDGMSIIYYPTDYNYLNLMNVNDAGNSNKVSMSHRLNIYGISLPPTVGDLRSTGVVLSMNLVWNVIPTPRFSDLLPLDYSTLDLNTSLYDISKFVPNSGLASFKLSETGAIERMLQLPSYVRRDGLNELALKGGGLSSRVTILDVLAPYLSPGVNPSITIDPKIFLSDSLIKRRSQIRTSKELNNTIFYKK